jgi:hypothetical protein
MSAGYMTRRAGADHAGRGWLTLESCGPDVEISLSETPGRGMRDALITLGNKLLTASNIFQFVMT